MKTLLRCFALGLLLAGGAATAGDCVMTVTRKACPGKEAESFAKCAGKASCEIRKPAPTAAICATKAKVECANSRRTVTQDKTLTALFDGAPVEGGKNFCEGHPDYPYRGKAKCE